MDKSILDIKHERFIVIMETFLGKAGHLRSSK